MQVVGGCVYIYSLTVTSQQTLDRDETVHVNTAQSNSTSKEPKTLKPVTYCTSTCLDATLKS